MRVGIVGVGAMGSTHAAAWSQTDAHLVGIVDTMQEQASALAAQYDARSYASLEALLHDVDIVDVCTPTLSASRHGAASCRCRQARHLREAAGPVAWPRARR